MDRPLLSHPLVFLLRVLYGDRRVGGRRDALSQSYFMFRPYRNYPCAFRTCFKTLHFSHSGKNTLANGIRLTTSRMCSRKTNGDGIQYSYKFRGSVVLGVSSACRLSRVQLLLSRIRQTMEHLESKSVQVNPILSTSRWDTMYVYILLRCWQTRDQRVGKQMRWP